MLKTIYLSQQLRTFFVNRKFVFFIYLAISIVAMVQGLFGDHTQDFTIFRSSWNHLLHHTNLYDAYPAEYSDYFLYHPLFPLLFAPFAILPVTAGFVCWIFFSAFFCLYVFMKLPLSREKQAMFTILVVFDLLNNLQDGQTNPFFLASMLLAWMLIEKENFFAAAFFVVVCLFVKSYGAIIALLVFFHKDWWKLALYCIGWVLAFHLPMLVFISPQQLLRNYQDWFVMISSEGIKEHYSVYGLLEMFHVKVKEVYIIVTAFVFLIMFLCIQIVSPRRNHAYIVAFLLIWMVVFNRSAESPTYLIAIAGAILYHLRRPYSFFESLLFWTTLIIASIFPMDLIPLFDHLRHDYYLKVVLCLIILLEIFANSLNQLLSVRKNTSEYHLSTPPPDF